MHIAEVVLIARRCVEAKRRGGLFGVVTVAAGSGDDSARLGSHLRFTGPQRELTVKNVKVLVVPVVNMRRHAGRVAGDGEFLDGKSSRGIVGGEAEKVFDPRDIETFTDSGRTKDSQRNTGLRCVSG